MKTTELHLALISSQDMTAQEAFDVVNEMRKRVYQGESPEDVLYEVRLEPDYLFDLI